MALSIIWKVINVLPFYVFLDFSFLLLFIYKDALYYMKLLGNY